MWKLLQHQQQQQQQAVYWLNEFNLLQILLSQRIFSHNLRKKFFCWRLCLCCCHSRAINTFSVCHACCVYVYTCGCSLYLCIAHSRLLWTTFIANLNCTKAEWERLVVLVMTSVYIKFKLASVYFELSLYLVFVYSTSDTYEKDEKLVNWFILIALVFLHKSRRQAMPFEGPRRIAWSHKNWD